jgi:hypothetical protein
LGSAPGLASIDGIGFKEGVFGCRTTPDELRF